MYNVAAITSCLFGQVGFRGSENKAIPVLPDDLLVTRSGLFFEDAHPLLTMENMMAVAPDFTEYITGDYDGAAAYAAGEYVLQDGKIYKALQDIGADSGILITNAAYWQLTSLFADWLRTKVQAAIKQVVASMFIRKKAAKNLKALLESAYIYESPANVNDREIKENRAVGLQITLKRSQGLLAILHKIGTQFTAAQGGEGNVLTLYLYHTSKRSAVVTKDISVTTPIDVQWHDMEDLALEYESTLTAPGGTWFLVYYEEDLDGQALNVSNFDLVNGPCIDCGGPYLYNAWLKWFRYMSVIPISVPASALNDDRTLWDWTRNQYYSTNKSFGLNLCASVKCDVSASICRQQFIFQDVIMQQFGVMMLKEIAMSTRLNPTQESIKINALYDLEDNEKEGKKGAKSELCEAIDALDFDWSELTSVCTPCDDRGNGVHYRAI